MTLTAFGLGMVGPDAGATDYSVASNYTFYYTQYHGAPDYYHCVGRSLQLSDNAGIALAWARTITRKDNWWCSTAYPQGSVLGVGLNQVKGVLIEIEPDDDFYYCLESNVADSGDALVDSQHWSVQIESSCEETFDHQMGGFHKAHMDGAMQETLSLSAAVQMNW